MVVDQVEETTPNTSRNNQPAIDAGNPLYIHPSDSPEMTLVSTPFDGIGYRSWRRSVLRALSVKNKLGFINGDFVKPSSDSPQFRQWERCDDMVTSWILNSLAKDISDSVEYVSNSAELWRELEDRYDQTNVAKLYQIQKEINDLTQGSLDITAYYTRMKRLWEELNTLSAKSQCSCNCTCGAKETMHKAEQDRRLIQFLMGLNEVYTIVRGSILMMKPLSSMAQAFSLLVQEEKQREFKPNNQLNLSSTSLHVNTNSQQQNSFGDRNFRTNYTANNGSRGRPFCDHCKKSGHTKEKCYKLHGYPQENSYSNQNFNRGNAQSYNQGNNQTNNQSYKFNKGRGSVANVHGALGDMVDEGEGSQDLQDGNQSVSLTKEQYGKIMTLLQHFQMGNVGSLSSNNNITGSANFAGPFTEEASGDW